MNSLIVMIIGSALIIGLVLIVFYLFRLNKLQQLIHFQSQRMEQGIGQQQQAAADSLLKQTQALHDLKTSLQQQAHNQSSAFDKQQIENLQQIQSSLFKGIKELRVATGDSLERSTNVLAQRFTTLQQTTDEHLQRIGQQVEQRLQKGFEKTNAVFTDIIKRLAVIDEAQKRITELSSDVVTLQQVLNDKRTRGAFGEVQLSNLLRNVLPEGNFKLQQTLSNNKRCDCLLVLPEPTGNIAIDAKFPLETYRLLNEGTISETERTRLGQVFQADIKHHIQDISEKYIIEGETSDGAIMFIPAEAIFAEIHAHYPGLVEYAQQQRVWLTSPTTMMAVLTTVRAVIKDDATRQQVHIIQDHLRGLSKDFGRFRQRMDNLSRHINMAQKDVGEVAISAGKITDRFDKIEKVELDEVTAELPD